MVSRRVFHESFDSTRATSAAVPDDPNLVQGQIEAVISLLLGRSLAVNNTYGLDSRTFLELADALLETRGRVLAVSRDDDAQERLLSSTPLVLFRWGQPTYFAACADQFRRHDKSAKNYFRLSAWGPMNEDIAGRDLLAATFERMDRDRVVLPFPAALARQYPKLAQRYETVLRVSDYLRLPGSDQDARRPGTQLGEFVQRLITSRGADLAALTTSAGCPEDRAALIQRTLKSRLDVVQDTNFLRGWAHDMVNELDPGDERFEMEMVREFVDTVYNAVLADSAQATFEYMSSVPRSDGRDELKQINALAMEVIRKERRPAEQADDPDAAERLTKRMGGLLSAASVLPGIPPQPLDQILTAYWELLADPDAARSWTQSVRRLHEELIREQFDTYAFQDAWSAHLGQLAQMLPHTVEVNGVQMAVNIRHGKTSMRQTQQLGEIERTALDAALAAGEHLDDLGHAASGVDRG